MLWSKYDVQFLIDNYGFMTINDIAKHIGKTASAIKSKSKRMKLNMSCEQKRKMHSIAMAEIAQSGALSGSNNPNYKGGISTNHYHYKKIQKERYPEKIRAREILYDHVKRGNIKRERCEVCGKENAHAHHEDYSKPLEVRWLCRKHHRILHDGTH